MLVKLEQINNDLKQAMREKNELVVSVLRMLSSAIKNKEISLRGQSQADLSDEQIVEVIKSEIKKRKDSIEVYRQGGREDLANKEEKEKDLLEKYLPVQMSDEELESITGETIAAMGEVGEKDFGKVMGQVMAKVKGRADGDKVSQAVKKFLTRA